MRMLTQTELMRLSKPELMVLLQQIAASLPHLTEGSHELRIAHANLAIIRKILTPRPGFGLG